MKECEGCPFWVSMNAEKKKEDHHCIKDKDGDCWITGTTWAAQW